MLGNSLTLRQLFSNEVWNLGYINTCGISLMFNGSDLTFEPNNVTSLLWFFTARVTSQMDPGPLYFTNVTTYSAWYTKIYTVLNVNSSGLCSSMCSLSYPTCNMFLYNSTSTFCYLGDVTDYSYNSFKVDKTASFKVYMRISKYFCTNQPSFGKTCVKNLSWQSFLF